MDFKEVELHERASVASHEAQGGSEEDIVLLCGKHLWPR
jgi:hypothetical protein